MTTNEKLRWALRNIEGIAVAALANQPNNADECGRHLNKALAVIEMNAHVARWGREGYPAKDNRESHGAGAVSSLQKGGAR